MEAGSKQANEVAGGWMLAGQAGGWRLDASRPGRVRWTPEEAGGHVSNAGKREMQGNRTCGQCSLSKAREEELNSNKRGDPECSGSPKATLLT
ncbi:unnamed protein product [Arctogadus glacialis]